jgi:hypothetical protein
VGENLGDDQGGACSVEISGYRARAEMRFKVKRMAKNGIVKQISHILVVDNQME